jgi:hypothetical protein
MPPSKDFAPRNVRPKAWRRKLRQRHTSVPLMRSMLFHNIYDTYWPVGSEKQQIYQSGCQSLGASNSVLPATIPTSSATAGPTSPPSVLLSKLAFPADTIVDNVIGAIAGLALILTANMLPRKRRRRSMVASERQPISHLPNAQHDAKVELDGMTAN